MAQHKIIHFFDVYTIYSIDGRTQASFVPKKGGVGSSLIMPAGEKTRELLFLHDHFWQAELHELPGGLPFLFPICGRLSRNGQLGTYLYDGRIYQLPIHGFSWNTAWEVEDKSKPDQITLVLRDTANTRAIYPFSFEVKLIYKVGDGVLTCEQIYTNKSQLPMPYYAGFHPYFLTPAPGRGKEKIFLDYQPQQIYCYNQDYTDLLGEKTLDHAPTSIMQPELNESLFKMGQNKSIKLIYPDNFILDIKAEGKKEINLFPYLQLYTLAKNPFFCVEPWMSFPNALNTVQGVRWLQPGESEYGLLTLKTGLKNP